jgi:hypothetical protein
MSSERTSDLKPINSFETPTNNNYGNNSNLNKATDTYHLAVLIHGIKGNCKEMGYIKKSIENMYKTSPERKNSKLIVYSATCNEKNSSDGIEAGGDRLVKEINDVLSRLANDIVDEHIGEKSLSISAGIKLKSTRIALSIIGYSMGGLYGRFAIRYINWRVPVGIGSTIVDVVVVPHIFATIATPHLGMKGMSYFKVPGCFESLAGVIFGRSGNDVFRRTISNSTRSRKSTNIRYHKKENSVLNINLKDESEEQYKYNDIIERLSFDPSFIGPLARFSRRIAYANAFSTDIAVPTATAAFLFDDDSDESASCEFSDVSNRSNPNDCASQPPVVARRSSHLFVSEFHGEAKSIKNIDYKEENNENQYSFVRFDTVATKNRADFKIAVENPPSVSDMARSLDSLGWSKVFIDARPHIPSIWKRSSVSKRHSFNDVLKNKICTFEDQNNDNLSWYSSGVLKRRLSGNGFDGNTLPFGHSFIVASTKDSMRKRLYKSARPIVDRAIAKEVVNEMFRFNSYSQVQ